MALNRIEEIVREALEESKAQEPAFIDVRGRTPLTDWIVVATGTSRRHVQAVARRLVESAKEHGVRALGIEGEEAGSEWVLIDLGDAVVHIMTAESRDFYRLERMWEMEETCASISSP